MRGAGAPELSGQVVMFCTLRPSSNRCRQLSKLSKRTLKIHAFHCEVLHQEKKKNSKQRSLTIFVHDRHVKIFTGQCTDTGNLLGNV